MPLAATVFGRRLESVLRRTAGSPTPQPYPQEPDSEPHQRHPGPQRQRGDLVRDGLAADAALQRTDAASTSVSASSAASNAAFDVAVLDIGLPGIDGYEVARRLRGSG